MVNICDKDKCCGCFSCVNICPKHCIEMKYDEYGVLLPYINQDICVDCKACQNVCPINNPVTKRKAEVAYAAWHLDETIRKRSASGGAAMALYETMLEDGGVVFGARFHDDLKLSIQKADTIEDAYEFKGSKYVQANVEFSYSEAKTFLDNNRGVLYIGTPCQIAGLKNYLRKDYENLITVDLICHGVPSIKYLLEHVNYINSKLNKNIDDITFRGAYSFELSLFENKKNIYHIDRFLDSYFTGFLNGLFYRPNCYKCLYACSERVSDITIGDFWGLGNEAECAYDMGNGVSVLLPNTPKGNEYIKKLKDRMFIDKRPLSEAINGNSQLQHPSEKNDKYELFKDLYVKHGFEIAASKCTEKEIAEYKKNIKVSIYKRIFRKIKRVLKL